MKCVTYIFSVALSMALTACSSPAMEVQSFDTLMDQINQNHEAVRKCDGDYSSYIVENKDSSFHYSSYAYNPAKVYVGATPLTAKQAEEDVGVLFKFIENKYGLYEYFGGEEVFNPAKEDILNQIKSEGALTSGRLEGILMSRLAFMKDGHFMINRKIPFQVELPFFFREVEFFKTKKGYASADGRQVASVDGYDHLDELFRPSISEEGNLVYYPVILEKGDYLESEDTPQSCSKKLTVHFSDKSTKILSAEPFQLSTASYGGNVVINETEGIPIIKADNFSYNDGGNQFLNSALEYKESPIVILDLRTNAGGKMEIPTTWMEKLAGEPVPSNSVDYLGSHLINTSPDKFVKHDNLLIILTGKYTISASERMVDMAYNLQNTLIIGENTAGFGMGDSGNRFQLPNSNIYIRFGMGLCLYPGGGYFEELRGFLPDIWVPSGEALELTMKYVENGMNQK